MAFVDCNACADRYRRHWAGIVLTILLSPFFWAWAALAALGRLFQPRPRQPRLCLLTGSRPLQRDVARGCGVCSPSWPGSRRKSRWT